MKTVVTNIDNFKWEFDTDDQFIAFTQGIYEENELTGATETADIPTRPESFEDCIEYINEYCGNLLLQTAEEQYFEFWAKNQKALYDIQKADERFYNEHHPELINMTDDQKHEFYRSLK